MICKWIVVKEKDIFNEIELICLHRIKYFYGLHTIK